MTPYIRKQNQSLGVPEYSQMLDWRPPKNEPLIRDELLMKALGLNDHFIFKKKKVEELQKLLNAEGHRFKYIFFYH